MSFEAYQVVDGQKMRLGFTTGTCALAATTAAIEALERGKPVSEVVLEADGYTLELEVSEEGRSENTATYSIVKDAGDDPDDTHGIRIYSEVTFTGDGEITLDGGEGIGRIRQKGLFGAIGEAAINPKPKERLMKLLEEHRGSGIRCIISAPEGVEIAKKTFNPFLGIEGGISILGTRGIVYPMSKDAYVATMTLAMDKFYDQGFRAIHLTPGNYGHRWAEASGNDAPIVEVSNYFGDGLRYAANKGFETIHVSGHIGKMSKLSVGIFNTHSAVSDTRMEAFVYYLVFLGAPMALIEAVDGVLTAEEALKLVREAGYGERLLTAMSRGVEERIKKYVRRDVAIRAAIYSMTDMMGKGEEK
ncbi:MAG: cobalt-precorrin-5B (C(1))-methyltransferase CbiD [Tissierellia bacterium]|nr:cobalt-precorrin-5B (C(1))-methyltransferase CbiD [Tissierellia bacterium]